MEEDKCIKLQAANYLALQNGKNLTAAKNCAFTLCGITENKHVFNTVVGSRSILPVSGKIG